jgi:aryl hydrocarbon receptor nuclear translocator
MLTVHINRHFSPIKSWNIWYSRWDACSYSITRNILQAANGFLFVIACDTGVVLYVADSIFPVLNMTQVGHLWSAGHLSDIDHQGEWLDRSIYELVHPDDVDKVRDQLSPNDVNASSLNRVLDLKSGTVKKETQSMLVESFIINSWLRFLFPAAPRVHMSCRRGFICRMRLGHATSINNMNGGGGGVGPFQRLRSRRPVFSHNGHHYVIVHCTGYIKNSPPPGMCFNRIILMGIYDRSINFNW